MGIGVSYTGRDGRKRQIQLDSVPGDFASFEAKLDPKRRRSLPLDSELRRLLDLDAQKRVGKDPADHVMTMPGSSIVKTPHGLALRGEDRDPLISGCKIFGSANGAKGFFTLDELDQAVDHGAVGPDNGVDSWSPSPEPVTSDGSPVTLSVPSRLSFNQDGGVYTLRLFRRNWQFTQGRRLHAVSGETEIDVASWMIPQNEEDTPLPFTLKKQLAKEGDEEESWTIYLPSDALVIYEDAVDVTSELTAVEGEEDWYALENISEGPVYLNIKATFDTASLEEGTARKNCIEVEASIKAEREDEEGEYGKDAKMSILIGEIGEESVVQNISGALVLDFPPQEVLADDEAPSEETDLLIVSHQEDGKVKLCAPIKIEGGKGIKVEQEKGKHDKAKESVFKISLEKEDSGDDYESEILSPFYVKRSYTTDGDNTEGEDGGDEGGGTDGGSGSGTNRTVKSCTITNCCFFYNGVQETLPDKEVPRSFSGNAYLTWEENEESSSEKPKFSIELGSTGNATGFYPLYTFSSGGIVETDYRTALVTVEKHVSTFNEFKGDVLLKVDEEKKSVTVGGKTIKLALEEDEKKKEITLKLEAEGEDGGDEGGGDGGEGGGEANGYSGTVTFYKEIKYTAPTLSATGVTLTISNGLITDVKESTGIEIFTAKEHVPEIS